jgi:hypothetical protein
MSLTVLRPLPALVPILLILASLAPAYAAPPAHGPDSHRPPPGTAQIDLYSPRVRRSTVTYLRLRLLELREEGLDRARAAIERRLSIDDLLREPRRPQQPAGSP